MSSKNETSQKNERGKKNQWSKKNEQSKKNEMGPDKHQRPRSGRMFAVSVLLICVLIVGGLVLWQKNSSSSSALNDLPNYTEIRGDFDAKSLKYEKQPHLGSGTSKVKVIEFADFKCPSCKQWKETYFDRFKQEVVDTGKADLYFMNFAFIDRDSIMAASAGEAIAAQSNDKFWEFMSKLYDHQGDETKIWATPQFLLKFVKNNIGGIDYDRFAKDLQEHTYMLPVKEDFKTAGNFGVNGTPQFMVNGKLLPDASYEGLIAAIDAAESQQTSE